MKKKLEITSMTWILSLVNNKQGANHGSLFSYASEMEATYVVRKIFFSDT